MSATVTRDGETSDIAREAVIASYPLDGPDAAAQLDRLARLAARLCDTPVGLVSLVESDRQRFIGRSGTDLTETPREYSFCAHAMLGAEAMVIPDATRDARFSDNPLVTEGPEIRFYAGQPLVSREGVPLGSLCVIDVQARGDLSDDQREGLEALADAASALLERWRSERILTLSSGEIARSEQRFQALADTMPQLVWSTAPDGGVDYVNRIWCEFVGQPPEASFGQAWMQFLHEDDKLPTAQCWLKSFTTGAEYEAEYRLRDHSGEYRWVLARGLPLRGEDGAIIRWIGTCTDIHEQKADAERLELLSRELNHRIKNIFAVIGGLIALTTRSKPEFSNLAADLRERILALGRAHDFVQSRGGQPNPRPHGQLSGLLKALLAPYQDADETRIAITGDEVAIDDRSATPLALFFHELATNAAKFGALSHDAGRVQIDVRTGEQVAISWRELGGANVREPVQPGFGTSLIEMSIVRQLGGTLERGWLPSGLCIEARIARSALAR